MEMAVQGPPGCSELRWGRRRGGAEAAVGIAPSLLKPPPVWRSKRRYGCAAVCNILQAEAVQSRRPGRGRRDPEL